MKFTRSLALAAAAALFAGALPAQDQATEAAIGARQAHMNLYAHNLGIVGGMARGNIPYDAEMAQTAAADLALVAQVSQQAYWPEGSSVEATDETRALPAIWENMEEFRGYADQLVEAAMDLESVAGDGQEALGAGLQGVGQACGGCHEDFRQEDE
ncbi:c-type cytochrome [Histidinibacterium aquaticum]|uniref:Cytochrome c n=1 Tax=Histidinibacterium aquaticum TaxID=2613962 RepID=A0A5J5GN72_9RHOB|nr:cytochrome c [Histidinibacterium aquaticum]KAA9008892.1 cytochrome c [Histidinibacterium aquaticum]